MDIMLSVVVETYNHEQYIEKCLDSILQQKVNFEYEIIVADDCSTDETVQLIERKYGDKVLLRRRNLNVGLCRNMYDAYMNANGKYIFECNGDDYLPVDSVLQKHVDFLEKNREYYSVSNWYLFVDEATHEEHVVKMPYKEYQLLDFLRGVPVLFYTGTIRNTFKEDQPTFLYGASRNNEEIQMQYYTLSKGKKAIISEPLFTYCYRKQVDKNNYCSVNGNLQILKDYMQGLYTVEKYDNGKCNFIFAKLVFFTRYFDKILAEKDYRNAIKAVRSLKFFDMVKIIFIKLIIKFNRYQVPEFLLKDKKLILTE